MKNFILTLIVGLVLILVLPSTTYAAISFIGSAEGGSANNGDPTADLTGIAGLAENDLVIAACGLGDADAVNGDVTMNTAGYTELNDLFQDDAHETNFAVYYKFMSSSVDTSAVCEGSTLGNDTGTAIVVMAFRGVDTTTPFDVASTSTTGIDDPDADPPSINHNNPSGVWTVIAVASAHALNTTCTSDAYVFPTGYTTDAIECAGNDTTDISVGMGYNSAPADPEDPGIVDHNGTDSTSNSWAAFTMALRPAITVAPTVTTSAASGVTAFSAVLNGNITATGGENATERGFAWGTDSSLSVNVSTTTESGDFGTGVFDEFVSNFAAGVTYYFRAYATNPAGTGIASNTGGGCTSGICSFTAGTDTTVTRAVRLFEGFRLLLLEGSRMIVNQQ